MYTVYECTDSPKFTMKLTEIYRYTWPHTTPTASFGPATPELTELIVCRKSRFLLEKRPRVPPYRTVSCSWVSCMAACTFMQFTSQLQIYGRGAVRPHASYR